MLTWCVYGATVEQLLALEDMGLSQEYSEQAMQQVDLQVAGAFERIVDWICENPPSSQEVEMDGMRVLEV